MTATLSHMVDLALGTPEVGAVNFNVLHTLLHALLGKLELSGVKAELSEYDKDLLSGDQRKNLAEDVDDSRSVADSGVTGLTSLTDGGERSGSAVVNNDKVIPLANHPYHQLESKVAKLDEQIQALNELPSNSELFTRAKGDGERSRPVSDMWQNMQLAKRVDGNEEGVSKLMSLVEDMMKELDEVRKSNEQLRKQMEEAVKANSLDDILKRLAELEKSAAEMRDRFDAIDMPAADFYDDFVRWSALEDSLRGIRQQIDNIPQPQAPMERVVIEIASQTDIHSRPPSSKPSTRPPSARTSTPGPSAELIDLLERLGKLTDRHDLLEERVDKLETDLNNKADKDALDGLSIPDDLLNQLKEMQDQLNALKKSQGKDTDALARMQQAIIQLQGEIERLSNMAQNLIDQNNARQKDIESLYQLCNKLEENKADKVFVQSEVDVKADKRHLDGKVNRSLFDSTCEELNKMINDILSKLGGHEDEWKKLLEQLTNDLDGKLDRLEFGPIRDELERQLKALMKKLNSLQFQDNFNDDDAAGIRKQLIQRFHCISCDRPVDMLPQGPIPSIPAPNALPATRSTRPYTTFELEQIRQHSKSGLQEEFRGQSLLPGTFAPQQVDVMDLYATQRSCGGSHTMTYPNRRITRMTQLNNLFREEEGIGQQPRDEKDIQGADGHIYRGRNQDAGGAGSRFPNLQTAPNTTSTKSPTLGRKAHTTVGPKPPAPSSPRPSSARASHLATSGRGAHGSRPSSATGMHPVNGEIPTTVPTAQQGILRVTPPPPPAPSEPDHIEQAPTLSPLNTNAGPN